MQISFIDLILILSYIYTLNIIFTHFFQIKFESGLPSTISLIVFILYLFGITSNLIFGYYLLLTLPLIISIVGINLYKNIPIQPNNIFTPGITIYTIWIFSVFYLYSNQALIHHDDLNFWGLTIKNSLAIDSIGNGPGTNSGYNDYPPGAALLAYFLGKIHGGYSEPISLFAMSIWGYSLLAFFAEKLNWKNYRIILLFIFSGYFIPSFFLDTDYHTSLTVDYLLSMVFGYGLFLSIRIEKKYNVIQLLQISFAIVSIVLLKKMGVFLSLIILLISIINITEIYNFKGLKSLYKNKFWIFILIISYIFPILSWKYYLKFHHLENLSLHNGFFNLIHKALTLEVVIPERLDTVWSIYWRALWSQSVTAGSINFSFISFIVFLLLLLMYLIKNISTKMRVNFLIILMSISLFLVGHFSMYGFIFSDGESMSLSSFSRYLLPLTVGLYIVVVAYLLEKFPANTSSQRKLFLFALLFLPILSLKAPESFKKPSTIPAVSNSIDEKISAAIVRLDNSISITHDPLIRQWAKNQLTKIQQNQKPDLPSRDLIADINEINLLKSQQEVQRRGWQMQQLFEIKSQSLEKGKNLCLIEGQEGSSYGHAMGFRYKFAPIVTKRILTYKSTSPADYEWHESIFYNELKSCGGVFVLGINDNFVKQYKKFFTSDQKNYGYYEVVFNFGKPKLKLIDCSICE